MARERCLTVGENIALKSWFAPQRLPFSLKKGRNKGRYLLKNTPPSLEGLGEAGCDKGHYSLKNTPLLWKG